MSEGPIWSLVFFVPLAARGAPWTAEQSNTKGAALVNALGSPRPRVRGVVKLPHTPRRRLGVTAHRQAECACGGPADAEPTFGGAPAIQLDRASFNGLQHVELGQGRVTGRPGRGQPASQRRARHLIAFFGGQLRHQVAY